MASSVTSGTYLSTLFTTGYLLDGAGQKLKGRAKVAKVECFDAMVRRMNLQVYDIRLNPWSQGLAWRRDQLKARLGQRYQHLPMLGNRNYKNGGAVDLVNAKAGKDALLAAYNVNQRRPLLLCGCDDVHCCHRADVARLFSDHFGQWVELEYWFAPKEIGVTDREHLGKPMPWFEGDYPFTPAEKVLTLANIVRSLMLNPKHKAMVRNGATITVTTDVYAALHLPEHAIDYQYLGGLATLEEKPDTEPEEFWSATMYARIMIGAPDGEMPQYVVFVTEEEEELPSAAIRHS